VLHSPPPQKYKVVATMFPEDENFKQWQSLESCWAVSSLNNKTMCLKRPFVYYISYPSRLRSKEMEVVIHQWVGSSLAVTRSVKPLSKSKRSSCWCLHTSANVIHEQKP